MDNNKIKEKNKYIIEKYNKDVENTGGKYLYNNGSAAEKYVKQRVLNNMMSIYDFSNLKKWFNNAGMKVTYSKFIDIVPVFCPDFAAHILNFFTPAFETLPIIKKLACARVIMLATKI
ncbi:hypothetical protein [Brachyspira pilosicoli]|uniref:hypothetical protein n=1 Tax=Brachyspira pilosicoli TaxID=52584 RepID=UPI000C7893D6|nr:hypothetical protein [Brachyspira pilosicoli]PLV64775.1 hypothetical protein BPSP16_00420 [Brachyspira pilosicoli SP16]